MHRILFIFLFVGMFVLVNACNSEEMDEQESEVLSREGFMKLVFNLPDHMKPKQNGAQTRAMDSKAERMIDSERLAVLVFDNDDKKTFLYRAPIVENSLQFNEQDPKRATVTLKLLKTEAVVNLMIVANVDVSTFPLEEKSTKWDAFVRTLTYKMPQDGKWNATTGSSDPFPMFGQVVVQGIKEDKNSFQVSLFRALARIDVGLNFKMDEATQHGLYSEETLGLSNFNLERVLVYRTVNEGYIGPLNNESNKTAWVPNVQRRSDDQPLVYELPTANEAKALVREIYVPEVGLPISNGAGEVSNDAVHCLVIGGSFDGGPTTYYRLDFAQEDAEGIRHYAPILRNHRYLFNIINVRSAGFTTADEALKSTSTTNVDFQLVSCDETIHEMHIQGQYYFGLDNREFTFEPRIDANFAKTNVADVAYQTNYPLTSEEPLVLKWASTETDPKATENFKAVWNERSKSIRITPLKTNLSNEMLTDTLHVQFGTFDIPIVVHQSYLDVMYSMMCETVEVHGTYKSMRRLGNDHFITLSIKADNSQLAGLPFKIQTQPIHGITFFAEGVLKANTEPQQIQLKGSGILSLSEDEKTEPFTVIIESNSSADTYCEATINPVMGQLNIVTIGSSDKYGYNLTNDTPSNWVFTNPKNFGPNDDSQVKIEGFNLINGGPKLDETALDWMEGFGGINGDEMADILHIAYNVAISSNGASIRKFMERGGVFVLFTEQNEIAFIKSLYGSKVNLSSTSDKFDHQCVPFLGNELYRDYYEKSTLEWDQYVESLRNDPILNGPFGDLTQLQWGEDAAGGGYVIDGLPEDDVHTTIYSRNTYITKRGDKIKDKSYIDYVSAFKYETDQYNFMFICDGGFTSQNGANISSSICPFWYDFLTHEPLPKPEYGTAKMPVYNAQFFCNIMAWAIDRATSKELMDKKDAFLKSRIRR